MRQRRWQLVLALGLVAASVATYAIDLLVFHNAHDTLFYLVGDLAFVPISVLLVTIILSQTLELRDRRVKLHRLNMMIGAFFSEVGNDLLERLSVFDAGIDEVREALRLRDGWTEGEFAAAGRRLLARDHPVDARLGDMGELRAAVLAKRPFMLALLQNPTLLEHERFTDLLWAVLHVAEELAARASLEGLPAPDLDHLSGDFRRAYGLLLAEWLAYVDHLRRYYPYLYSLAVRTNPFDPAAGAVVA